jgi:hypothetical protein
MTFKFKVRQTSYGVNKFFKIFLTSVKFASYQHKELLYLHEKHTMNNGRSILKEENKIITNRI